jgi:hypothetical protein
MPFWHFSIWSGKVRIHHVSTIILGALTYAKNIQKYHQYGTIQEGSVFFVDYCKNSTTKRKKPKKNQQLTQLTSHLKEYWIKRYINFHTYI